jgi:signal transduction histidine kinase
MFQHLLRPSVFVMGVFIAIAGGLGWLMFGLAGNNDGIRALPDSESGSSIATLADPERRRTIVEVAALPDESWSEWSGRGYIRAGAMQAVWVRVTLRNATDESLNGVLVEPEYFTDHLEFWEGMGKGGGIVRHFVAGESVSIRDKPVWGRGEAFPVELPAGGEKTFYLRGEDRFAVWARVAWWPRLEDYLAAQVRDVLAEGICYGGLLALLLYNAVLWVRLRHVDTGYYVLYATAMLSANTVSNNGTALLGLVLSSPAKEVVTIASLTISALFLVQFGRASLETKERMPRADRLARWLRNLMTGLTALTAVIPWMRSVDWVYFVVPLAALSHVWLLGTAVMAWRRGVQHARFIVLAFGAVFAGGMPSVVMWMDLVVTKKAAMGVVIGSTLEILLLALAVADRFARMQREKAEAQQRVVEETEQRRAIEEAYAEELKIEVRERTAELERANTDKDQMLSIIGHDLRAPLTGLLHSAEGASDRLGRETAETSRALLLLIEDLVLWARLQAAERRVSVYPAVALAAPALALHQALAEHQKIVVRIEVDAALQVETDLVLAQTLVRNLLANALKFARTTVVVRATMNDAGGAWFSVENDGPPLSPEIAARLVADEDGPITASGGLGLRLCRQICRVLGMKLVPTAGIGGGTSFGFLLNAAQPAPVEVRA